MELKTFTVDSYAGKENEEFCELMRKYESKITELCNDFVTECNSNNIESCSSNGWFIDTIVYTLSLSRVRMFYDKLKNDKSEEIEKEK